METERRENGKIFNLKCSQQHKIFIPETELLTWPVLSYLKTKRMRQQYVFFMALLEVTHFTQHRGDKIGRVGGTS